MNQFKSRLVMYRLLILAGAALLPGLVAAQTTPAAPAALPRQGDFEEIVVTGSRISREALESPSPVTVITGDQFRNSNAVNVEEVLLLLPQVTGFITAEVNNGGDGTAQVALRSLEPQRTLVLVNGRRMVPATNDGIVDINSIPAAMIERVEVVTGGASAVYGSDAIAGVINFILKENFEGLEVNTIAGVSGEWDAQRYGINLTGGQNFDSDRGNVTFSLGYSKLYGPIAILPLFLLWVYVTWIIILSGLQVAHALQTYTTAKTVGLTRSVLETLGVVTAQAENRRSLIMDPAAILVVMVEVSKRFVAGTPRPGAFLAVGVEHSEDDVRTAGTYLFVSDTQAF